jgi:uncharacterized protein (TIGR03067 family)
MRTIRVIALVGVVVGTLVTTQVGSVQGDQSRATEAENIARLIKQLGDYSYEKREAASKELSAIGEPALASLRSAVMGSNDLEIRVRAEQLIAEIQFQAPKKVLSKLEGTWIRQTAESNGKVAPKDVQPVRYLFKGNSVSVKIGDSIKQKAIWTNVNVLGDAIIMDYTITEGVNQGGKMHGLFILAGDELRWCYCYAQHDRPTTFETKAGDNKSLVTLKREKPEAADPFRDALVVSIHHFAEQGKLAHMQAVLDKYPELLDAKPPQQFGKPTHGDAYTPFQTAAWRGQEEVVAFLVKKGADVNVACGLGYTPLHLAAKGGHLGVVKLLVKAGAKTDAKTTAFPEGFVPSGPANEAPKKLPAIPARTALQIAEDLKHAEVVE